MKKLSFHYLNCCAFAGCGFLLVSVLFSIFFHLYWFPYFLLAVCCMMFLLLFLAYERKVCDFFDAVNEEMEQMLSREEKIDFLYAEDSENIFSRFLCKLTRLYEALRISEEKAEQEKHIMQGMIADLSHQIKTPVANIKMDLELLSAREMSCEKRQEFLERTLHQADKMDFLIQSIIKMSRLESGAVQLIPQNEDLAQTLAKALLSISAAADKKEITVSVECPQPLLVRHDPKWTEEAIYNLLDNAVKYTPVRGQIQICVELREAGAYLSITDTGMGIPEELQGAVFSKFFRAPEVHNMPGAGVGLYLTRQIIEAQGGYVTVKSGDGSGSTFSIQLL